MQKYVRTCQECGHRQLDTQPDPNHITDTYRNRKCKKCRSEALDLGSLQDVDKDLKRIVVKDDE